MANTLAYYNLATITPGKSYRRGKLSTVNLLVLTSLDQFLFKLKILIASLTKQATLMRRSSVLGGYSKYFIFFVT